jgi:hypothetical protein
VADYLQDATRDFNFESPFLITNKKKVGQGMRDVKTKSLNRAID